MESAFWTGRGPPSNSVITGISSVVMETHPDLTGYAHALGRAQAAWRFATPALRRAAALATISAAWDVFRRDAGAGAVGPAHETTAAAAQLLFSDDPRRDAVLLWLADHAAPELAEAAATLAGMVGATRRFGADEHALLDAARDALAAPDTASGPIARRIPRGAGPGDPVVEPLQILARAVDRLRGDAGFVERSGDAVQLPLPGGTLSHYVPADPAGCWALNLALLGRGAQPAGTFSPPGLVSRALFRRDLEPDEIAVQLTEGARLAWSGAYHRLLGLEPELDRGREALAHLSRNARTRDAWLLVAALTACTRTHIARALGLSRAGADIQANALADAGLATLGAGGRITWAPARTIDTVPAPLDQGPLADAVSDLDARLAEIDRLLARTAR